MGKASRNRRREAARQDIANLDPEEVWALLIAAGASPSVRHQWPRVGMLASRAVKFDHSSGRPARREMLKTWLDEIGVRESLASLEDYVPEDPRDDVRIRVGDRLLRLGPGEVERPIADVERALMCAAAVDSFLVRRKGFGIRDVVDVLLTYQDVAISMFTDAWPSGPTDFDGPVVVAEAEVAAARRLVDLGTPAVVTPTERHCKALEWLTCTADDLPYQPDHPQSSVQRFVRVITALGPRWLPLHLIPAALGYAVAALAAEVATDSAARRAFAELAAQEARESLWHFGEVMGAPDVDGLPRVSPDNDVQWVSNRTARRSTLVQVETALRVDLLNIAPAPEALRAARAANAAAGSGTSTKVRMSGGEILLRRGAEVVPLLVVATPAHVAVPHQQGLPGLSLDDLRWIAATSEDRSDLFNYCRDMSRTDLPRFAGWEAIDTWEWWRSNHKTFFSGGQAPSFISIAPHGGTAEWKRAAKMTVLEIALANLGLPPTGRFQIEPSYFDEGAPGPATIVGFDLASRAPSVNGRHETPPLNGWVIACGEVPVAVTALAHGWNEDDVEFLSNLAEGFAHMFYAISHVWNGAHTDRKVAGYRIHLDAAPNESAVMVVHQVDRSSAPASAVTAAAGAAAGGDPTNRGGIESDDPATGCARTEQARTGDGSSVVSPRELVHVQVRIDLSHVDEPDTDFTELFHHAFVDTIGAICRAAGVGADQVKMLEDAAREYGPTFAAQTMGTRTSRNDLRPPVAIDPALVSRVDRTIAEAVQAAGVEPGDYTGAEANDLDRDVLAPTALHLLVQTLSIHSSDDLILFGMEQIERCIAQHEAAQGDLAQSAERLHLSWDPVARQKELESAYLQLRRCIETAVEATLRSSPDGLMPVDDVAWGEILAAARGYLDATTRSEAIHHNVNPNVVRVSSTFELTVRPSDSTVAAPGAPAAPADRGEVLQYNLDMDGFNRVRATETLAGEPPVQIDGPIPARLDDAMLAAFGASATDILTVLLATVGWPMSDDDPDALAVERDKLVEFVVDQLVDEVGPNQRVRYANAVELLSSTPEELSAADWKPWQARSRKKRLLIQPFPALSDGRVVISPRLSRGAASAYIRYLVQGQLPWSQPAPPKDLESALEEVRDARNKALEIEVDSLVRGAGWVTKRNIKEADAARLGVPALQTEVDIVAGRAGDPNLWLLEVKDPAEVFALADIRRLLDRFFLQDEKKKAYVAQLQRKFDDLSPYPDDIAKALGLPPRDESSPYVVRARFVTRRPVPAEFVPGPFPFTSVSRLIEHLERARPTAR